jgi:hypothetical protein
VIVALWKDFVSIEIWNKMKSYISPLHTVGGIQVSEPVIAEHSLKDLH